MKKLVTLSLLIFISCIPRASDNAPDVFLIVSIDALHPEALMKGYSPHIDAIARKGEYTLQGKSVTPPKTLYNHAAMFTGKKPEDIPLSSNSWDANEPTVPGETIFTIARTHGMNTGYFYAKEKLGYLTNPYILESEPAGEYTIDSAYEYIQAHSNTFVFLHISGLDIIGPKKGWLSPDYYTELSRIDKGLAPLIEYTLSRPRYYLIITSDHAGHDKKHGTENPEDYRLPFIRITSYDSVSGITPDTTYSTTELKTMVGDFFNEL